MSGFCTTFQTFTSMGSNDHGVDVIIAQGLEAGGHRGMFLSNDPSSQRGTMALLFTGFCVEGHTHAIRARELGKPKRNNSLWVWVAEQLDIKLHIVDVIEEYKQVLLNPKHWYGANLNPCLDCKVFTVGKARQWIKEHCFDFIITGEVRGQRPCPSARAQCRWHNHRSHLRPSAR